MERTTSDSMTRAKLTRADSHSIGNILLSFRNVVGKGNEVLLASSVIGPTIKKDLHNIVNVRVKIGVNYLEGIGAISSTTVGSSLG
jgi:hypothetical protein